VQKGIERRDKEPLLTLALWPVPALVYPVSGPRAPGESLMKPAGAGPPASSAGGAARAILEMGGVKDIIAKSHTARRTAFNVAHARSKG